eukprot:5474071-Pyramimonas_sp.AAC.1
MYWLETNGKKDRYYDMSPAERKTFALAWYAEKCSQGTAVESTERTVTHQEESGGYYEWWMSKEKMQRELGIHKTENKLQHGNLEHRPDADTGMDDEWSREWKVWIEKGSKTNRDRFDNKIGTEKELTEEEK